jgi:hypothetical protein
LEIEPPQDHLTYSRTVRRPSLTAKLLAVVLTLSFAFTGVCAVAGFLAFRHAFIQAKEADLTLYAKERGRGQNAVFRSLTLSHQAAADALTRRLDTLSDAQVDRRFEQDFPLRPDGTRRTDSSLFDGRTLPSGQVQFGLGGYITHGKAVSRADKRLMLAALDVVQELGESQLTSVDNFDFFTPNGDLVVFAPTRPDRLMRLRFGPLDQLRLPMANKSLSGAVNRNAVRRHTMHSLPRPEINPPNRVHLPRLFHAGRCQWPQCRRLRHSAR